MRDTLILIQIRYMFYKKTFRMIFISVKRNVLKINRMCQKNEKSIKHQTNRKSYFQ